jgi:hypothetical protein
MNGRPATGSALRRRRLSLCFWKSHSVRAFLPIFAVLAAALFLTGTALGQETNRYTKVANQLMELINAGDYAGIQAKFNKEMDAALPLDKSSAFFRSLTQRAGKIQELGEPRSIGEAMVYPAKFEKASFDMRIALDGHDLIAGLLFKPHAVTKADPEKHQAKLDRYTKAANELVELINAGDYADIEAKFNPEMGAALPLDKASEFFKGMRQQAGKIQKLGTPQPVGGAMVFPAEFEKGTGDMKLVLDSRGLIAGLRFTPHAAAN